jgi:probable rRNA maturation factor
VNSKIQFFSEYEGFVLKDKGKIRTWLINSIREEETKPRYINFIFCSDDYLFELNKAYLRHETLTDILTFPADDGIGVISGDIFISVDRVRENAILYETTFGEEIRRVMIHGILHLVGYKDKSANEKQQMRMREDFYLQKSEK